VKQPTVRDRSDADPNLGTVTGRTDLSSGYAAPPTAQVPGCDPGEKCVAEKAQKPVTANPVSGSLSTQPVNTQASKAGALVDLTTTKIATGPAIANPNLGNRNSRS
jgi:hypothetical protein